MDWFLRNILLLDPTHGRTGDDLDPGGLGVEAEPEEELAKLLLPLLCTIDIAGTKKEFKVRLSKSPSDAIVLCRPNGEQVRQLAASTVQSVNRLTERRVGIIFTKAGSSSSDVDESIQAEFEFRNAAGCRQFTQGLHRLFGFEILDPLADKQREWAFTPNRVENVETGVGPSVTLHGSGAFDETFTVEYSSKHVQETDTKNKMFPFTAITWYLSDPMGGVNRAFDKTVGHNKNQKHFALSSLLVGRPSHKRREPSALVQSGRFVQAEVDVDRKALKHKKDKAHFKVTKGPVIPSTELTAMLLELFCVNSTKWPVSAVAEEMASVLPLLWNVPPEIIEASSSSWHSPLNTEIVVTTNGLRFIIPGHSYYHGFRLKWTECLAALPSPFTESGSLVPAALTRKLAYTVCVSFLDPTGSHWLNVNLEFTGQQERDAFWHIAMYFLLHRANDQSTFNQWELDRKEGKTSDLQARFRDAWLALDFKSIAGLVEIPSMFSEPQEEVKVEKPDRERRQPRPSKVRDKRTLLRHTANRKGEEAEAAKEEEDQEAFLVTQPQDRKVDKGRKSWESSSGSALSEDDPAMIR
eukprot:Protomagalhaensia_sp_Gyna_25__1369@NODE_168_length_4674_cov_14_666882_g131_i0_p2_GENE_NODE_168_length_4674_cov_14_666882_g131_i0NODE_168_length_4674_cov_14_666882_g131_i0_p2_ORF_typecomplete_len580_score132_24TonB_N/PF16031_5/0_83_NODE_168_length_4674_cov_14_666882_g131_i028934632